LVSRVALEVLDNLLEELEPVFALLASLDDTFKLDASEHSLLVGKVPLAADVPVLRKVRFPVLVKALSGLYKSYDDR